MNNENKNCPECEVISLRLKAAPMGACACSTCKAVLYGPDHPMTTTLSRQERAPQMYPTAYFQWTRRDSAAPSRVLQQWWANRYSEAARLLRPEQCEGGGQWFDVPDEAMPGQGRNG